MTIPTIISTVLLRLQEHDPDLANKLEWLLNFFRKHPKIIVAFSGGVDSSLLAYLAYQMLQSNAIAVTAETISFANESLEQAKTVAKEIGIPHYFIQYDELANPDFVKNPENRCYYCKQELSKELVQFADQFPGSIILEGTNASELEGHRPGYKAVQETHLYTPLADANLQKREIRKLAQLFKISVHNQPSSACLCSRIPYHQPITPETLRRIESGETGLHKLFPGIQIRLRDHEYGKLARIEIDAAHISLLHNPNNWNKLLQLLKPLGYQFVTIDLEGYRPSSPN